VLADVGGDARAGGLDPERLLRERDDAAVLAVRDGEAAERPLLEEAEEDVERLLARRADGEGDRLGRGQPVRAEEDRAHAEAARGLLLADEAEGRDRLVDALPLVDPVRRLHDDVAGLERDGEPALDLLGEALGEDVLLEREGRALPEEEVEDLLLVADREDA